MSRPSDSAFPVPGMKAEYHDGSTLIYEPEPGLAKRELFAAMAMQGMLANDKHLTRTTKVAERLGLDADESIATQAREIADALLAELAKPQEGSAS